MKLIINADDFGLSKSTNEAIIKLANKGAVTSTTVMVNMPYYEEIRVLNDLRNFSIGLHINLTQGRPVSASNLINSLIDKDGYFFSSRIFKRKAYLGQIKKEEVRIEILNQFSRLKTILDKEISHFDSHQDILKIRVVMCSLVHLKKSISSKMGVRVYTKSYVEKQGQTVKLISPALNNIRDFGLRSFLIEFLLKFQKKYFSKYFTHTDGFILTRTHSAHDILIFLTNSSPIDCMRTFEICCHPAITFNDIPNTTLKETRVETYQFLNSDEFNILRNKVQLINYRTLINSLPND